MHGGWWLLFAFICLRFIFLHFDIRMLLNRSKFSPSELKHIPTPHSVVVAWPKIRFSQPSFLSSTRTLLCSWRALLLCRLLASFRVNQTQEMLPHYGTLIEYTSRRRRYWLIGKLVSSLRSNRRLGVEAVKDGHLGTRWTCFGVKVGLPPGHIGQNSHDDWRQLLKSDGVGSNNFDTGLEWIKTQNNDICKYCVWWADERISKCSV